MKSLLVSFREYILSNRSWTIDSIALHSSFHRNWHSSKLCATVSVRWHGKSLDKISYLKHLNRKWFDMSWAFMRQNMNFSVGRCILNFGILHEKISFLPSSLVNLSFCKRFSFHIVFFSMEIFAQYLSSDDSQRYVRM